MSIRRFHIRVGLVTVDYAGSIEFFCDDSLNVALPVSHTPKWSRWVRSRQYVRSDLCFTIEHLAIESVCA